MPRRRALATWNRRRALATAVAMMIPANPAANTRSSSTQRPAWENACCSRASKKRLTISPGASSARDCASHRARLRATTPGRARTNARK